MRRDIAALILVAVVALAAAPSAGAAKDPRKIKLPAKYEGTITSVFSEAKTSFKLDRGGHLENFSITFLGEPHCTHPVPEWWQYPLPQSAKFEVLEEFRVTQGGKIFPNGSDLSYGFYPFPPVAESHHISGFMILDAKFVSRNKAEGAIEVTTDDFILEDDGTCAYLVAAGEWQAKRKR